MTDSWWLKLHRADQHLAEVHTYLRRYERKHAYGAVRMLNTKSQHDVWRYILNITEQPDEMLPLAIGDMAHNMRSALDHILVAMRPRKYRHNPGYPILVEDPWDGPKPNLRAIESFDSATAGLSAEAIAAIKGTQPYIDRLEGADPARNALRVLSRLDNADKHREPIVVVPGLVNATAHVTARGEPFTQGHPLVTSSSYPGLVQDGADVAHFRWIKTPALRDSEVKVEIRGTPLVAVNVGLDDGHMTARGTLSKCLGYLWETVIPVLEQHLP